MDYSQYRYSQSESSDSFTLNETPVEKLKRLWMNETFAPDLLPYDEDLINKIVAQIKQQEDSVSDNSSQVDEQFLANLYTMELERVKYTLRCYYRIRLQKIEKHYLYLLKNDSERSKLSSDEQKYLESFSSAINKHFQQSFLQYLPEKRRSAEDNAMVLEPNLDTHVFCKVNSSIGELEVDPDTEDTVRLEDKDIWLIRYRPIRHLLSDGKLQLL